MFSGQCAAPAWEALRLACAHAQSPQWWSFFVGIAHSRQCWGRRTSLNKTLSEKCYKAVKGQYRLYEPLASTAAASKVLSALELPPCAHPEHVAHQGTAPQVQP